MKKKGNAIAKEVRTPKYRQRVERDRTKYSRKVKHGKGQKCPLFFPGKAVAFQL